MPNYQNHEILSSVQTGISAPVSQSILIWTVRGLSSVEVLVGAEDNARLELTTTLTLEFRQNLLVAGHSKQYLFRTENLTMQSNTEPLLESDLYMELSEDHQAKLLEILRRFVRARSAVESMTAIGEIPADAKELNKQKRRIEKRLDELAEFNKAHSKVFCEEASITDARGMDWWNDEVSVFFLELMEGKPQAATAPRNNNSTLSPAA